MPRAPRVVYAGAIYHLMCRGDRHEAIYRDDRDCERFLETLTEACERTGWLIHAYALMGNHYHLLAETPEPNLVEGMKWFQGTYTQRFNVRHRLNGHLFQGRYKALVVEGKDSEYFRTVADYIHLNPARAGLLSPEQPDVRSYPWSSARYFARSRRHLEEWLTPKAVFRSQGLVGDTSAGRRRFAARLNALARAIMKAPEDERWTREWAKIRRGWYLGEEGFRDHLLNLVDSTLQSSNPDSHSGEAVRQHHQQQTQADLDRIIQHLGLTLEELWTLPQNDPVKQGIAWWLRSRSMVPNAVISECLAMGSRANIFRALQAYRSPVDGIRKKIKRDLIRCPD